MPEETDNSGGWGIERKVSIGAVLVFLLQTVALGIWIGTLQSDVSGHEVALTEIRQEKVAEKLAIMNGRIDTIIAVAQQTDRNMDRIERQLGRIERADRNP